MSDLRTVEGHLVDATNAFTDWQDSIDDSNDVKVVAALEKIEEAQRAVQKLMEPDHSDDWSYPRECP